jgi:sigma-E factor negative regulatory protein RseA
MTMKPEVSANECRTDDASATRGEWLSALFDGECTMPQVEALLTRGDAAADRATWDAYRCIGQALRAQAAAHGGADPAFVRAVMARVAHETGETLVEASSVSEAATPGAVSARMPAANDAVFRWKVVAGVAAVAAAVAIVWGSGGLPGAPEGGAQWARNTQDNAPAPTVVSAPAVPASASSGVVRDPQIEELMAAHRQWGGASALQTSAGFLRAASYDVPAR